MSTAAMPASAPVVAAHAHGNPPTVDGIFSGLSFFLVQRVPSRSSFADKIQSNGGRVVKIDTQADHVVADHYRKDSPPGSISYTFIDAALKSAALPDPKDHAAGPPKGASRPAASGLPAKGTRTPFTAEDDRALYTWVKKCEAKGGSVKGNELYKQLEATNPRHTYQAWRDRYIRRLMDSPPTGVNVGGIASDEDDAPVGPDARADRHTQRSRIRTTESPRKKRTFRMEEEDFDEQDLQKLIDQGDDIENMAPDRIGEAWDAFAGIMEGHSANAWRRLWEENARPVYLNRRKTEDSEAYASTRGKTAKQDVPLLQTAGEADAGSALVTTSERPASPASLKRKRGTPTPKKPATYGRKRQKDGDDILGGAEPDHENLSNGATPTVPTEGPYGSAAKSSASASKPVRQDRDRTGMPPPVSISQGVEAVEGTKARRQPQDEPIMSISEANMAAAMQLDDDFMRMLAEESPQASQQDALSAQVDEDDNENPRTTSEANHAVVTRLNDEHDQAVVESIPGTRQHGNDDVEVAGRALQTSVAVERGIEATVVVDLTSDLNRNADQQLRRESFHRLYSEDEDDTSSSDNDANLPTSDVNRFADQQLQKESLERDEQDSSDSVSPTNPESLPFPGGSEAQVANGDSTDFVQPQRDALTEANLASQDEQHRDPLVRGTDLPQDDEMQDQSDFVQYLQSLQGGAQHSAHTRFSSGTLNPMLSLPTQEQSMLVEVDDVHRESPALSPQQGLGDLPLVSQQELDEIMDETLQWPESPMAAKAGQTSKNQSQDNSGLFETQVPYPLLPVIPQRDDAVLPPGEPQTATYPDLPRLDRMVKDRSLETLQARFDREVLAPAYDLDHYDAESEGAPIQNEQPGAENEVDLEIAEPPGGLEYSSSQGWSSQLETKDRDHHETRQGVGQNLEQYQDAQDDIEAAMPGHAGGCGFAPSSLPHSQASQAVSTPKAYQPSVIDEVGDDEVAQAHSRAAIEIISSTPSSSAMEPHEEADRDVNGDFSEDSVSEEDIPYGVPRAIETQDVYNAETQMPDLGLPPPPDLDSEHDDLPSSPHRPTALESQAALADTQALSDDDVDEYINRMTLAYNYTESAVVEALKCTSMRPDLADLVLLEGKAGKGLPSDVPGIWSKEEDQALEDGNAKVLKVLEDKHGWQECLGRMEWLGEWREGEEEEAP